MVEEEKIIKRNNMMVGTATGLFEAYHDVNSSTTTTTTTNPNEFFNFEQNNSVSHNNNNNNSDLFWKPSPPPSNKPLMNNNIAGGFGQFDDDDQSSSLQRCVLIPCEPNERPSQGLSLSLSSANPSTLGIQPFELVRSVPQDHHHLHLHHHNQGYFGKPMSNIMHEEVVHDMMTHELYRNKSTNHIMNASANSSSSAGGGGGGGGGGVIQLQHQHHHHHHQSVLYTIRSSRYLVPAQDILNEFCNLGSNQNDHPTTKAYKAQGNNQWQDHDNNLTTNASSSKNKPLNSLEFLELQKRKSKLLQMLEEVDRKYHNYRHQMKAVVSSFEAVAGDGAATVYSSLASKAMSRHFRCLRDGILGQIKDTKKAMGEKDLSSPGATRGETPRLRLLDQTLRQQRAFQQMTMMDNHPWRPQRGLPERSVSVLRAWLFEHFLHPYPSDVDKHILARQTGLSRSQVSNWFINARVRLWKPMVEEMYVEETKDHNDDQNNIIDQLGGHNVSSSSSDRFNGDNSATIVAQMDQKPSLDQLIIRRDSDQCLSSIVINHHDVDIHHHTTSKSLDHHHDIGHQSFARVTSSSDPFGAVEMDFSAYSQNFGSGGGVSLTLGLQQHAGTTGGGGGGNGGTGGGDGGALYYPRDHMDDDCQNAVQYSSLLEGDQGQNLPYRNLMGAQLLHDLAG